MMYFISLLKMSIYQMLLNAIFVVSTASTVVVTPQVATPNEMEELVKLVEMYDPDHHENKGVIIRRIRPTDLQMVITNKWHAKRGSRRYTITISYSDGKKRINFWRRPYGTIKQDLLVSFDDADLDGNVDYGFFHKKSRSSFMSSHPDRDAQNKKYLYQLHLDRAVKDCLQVLRSTKGLK